MQIVTQTHISEFPLLARGKVRDMYEIDPETLLIVTTDRMSAFDVVMHEPIPYKGVVLHQLTVFWMRKFASLVPNHLLECEVGAFPRALRPYASMLEGRSALVRKAKPLPMECIVRGNIAGSGWKEYKATGSLCGLPLPGGLRESEALPVPLFTPSTKVAPGAHDENISRETAMRLAGEELFLKAEELSLAIFIQARDYAAERGIIIADTKFEFGLVNGELFLIDEVLTPDSSRFWARDVFAPGKAQPGFDKQLLRDWLEEQDWNKMPPPPTLPPDIIAQTAQRYREAYVRLTGETLGI